MNILQRLRTLEAWLLPAATLDHWQQQTFDLCQDVVGGDVAAACLPDITCQPSHWLQVGLLIGTIKTGAPPAELEREMQYYRNTSFVKVSATLAALDAWLASPAGRERYVNPHYAFRHQGPLEREVEQALGRGWLTATGDSPALWDSLDADDQYQAWWRALVALAWWRCGERRIFGADPPSRAATIVVSETGLALVREWLAWCTGPGCLGASGAVYHCTGRWPDPVPDPSGHWTEEIAAAFAAVEERATYAEQLVYTPTPPAARTPTAAHAAARVTPPGRSGYRLPGARRRHAPAVACLGRDPPSGRLWLPARSCAGVHPRRQPDGFFVATQPGPSLGDGHRTPRPGRDVAARCCLALARCPA